MNDALASLQLNVVAVLPEAILVVATLVLLMMDAFGGNGEETGVPRALPWVAMLGVLASAASVFWLWSQPPVSFQGHVISDRFANSVRLIVLTAAALAILFSNSYIGKVNKQTGEYYALLLLCTAGMGWMGAATDLIVLFIALEIFSLALYILTGLHRTNPRSTEAAMKYFLLGAFASGFLVYGGALIYGATGTTQYDFIAQSIAAGQADPFLLNAGIGLLIVGLGFKISVVPFHMWTPDVYQGAPTPVTAFMSAGTKAAAFAALARLLVLVLPEAQPVWSWMLAVLAVLTMVLGNLAALRQSSLKRMLAYSTIAHAGYILVALVPGTVQGADAALFYLFTYAFMNMGAFAVIMAMERTVGEDALQANARGMGSRSPLLAFLMAVFMFGLSGMPPLAGFFGKFYVFGAAVQGGWAWLAVVGMITSAIGVYYYLRVIVSMYFDQPDAQSVTQPHTWGSLQLGMAVAAAFTIIVGILPGFWADIFRSGFGG
jgi:NADH-quinone oxidoreductase subunit N